MAVEDNAQNTETHLAEEKEIYYCAPFWKRLVAYIIDYVFVQAIALFFGIFMGTVLGFVIALFFGGMEVTEETMQTPSIILIIIVFFLYFSIMEASYWRATFGKKIMKIIVTDEEGNRISFWRSLLRNFGKCISIAVFAIGCLVALFTEKRQALYDLIARTFVVDSPDNLQSEKPPALIPSDGTAKQLQ